MSNFFLAPLFAAAVVIGMPAQAAVTLKLDGYLVGSTLGTGAANSASNAALSRTMQWQVDSISTTTGIYDIAGQFGGTVNDGSGAKPFAAYCVELTQTFNPFPTGNLLYDKVDAASYFSASVYNKIGRLYSQNIVFDSAEKTAAFQIALWEIVYETTPSLAVGDASRAGTADFFSRPGGTATAATFSLAQSYLNALATTTFDQSRVGLVVYKNANSQDLIVAVPEPETYALMLAGLGGIGLVAARRRSAG